MLNNNCAFSCIAWSTQKHNAMQQGCSCRHISNIQKCFTINNNCVFSCILWSSQKHYVMIGSSYLFDIGRLSYLAASGTLKFPTIDPWLAAQSEFPDIDKYGEQEPLPPAKEVITHPCTTEFTFQGECIDDTAPRHLTPVVPLDDPDLCELDLRLRFDNAPQNMDADSSTSKEAL